jgi:serine/threonine protein kinase
MGTVYEAHDVRLGRHVAIKVLHQALTSPEGSRRFVQETHVIAGLSHPNIVAVHESGEAAGRLYFVMDVIDGETLRQRLRREKQLAVDEALRIVGEVASALQHAHERGIVHRDIKPENILLSGARVYVADFGLARSVVAQEGDRITESGISVGTPHYLSPEQAAAERDVGPQADQYALACVLYEMLVGEAPFTGPSATAIAMRHLSEPPPPVTTRRATVPAPVERAIHRALSKVPADRHVSVKAFADACLRSMETPTPVETLSTRPRTRPWWWVTGVAAAAVVAITTLSRRDRTSDARPSETPPAEPTRLLVVVPTAPDAAFASLADEVQRAFAQWEDADVQVVSDSSQRAGLSREALEAAARRASMRQYNRLCVTCDHREHWHHNTFGVAPPRGSDGRGANATDHV